MHLRLFVSVVAVALLPGTSFTQDGVSRRVPASADSVALRALEDRWEKCMVAQDAACLNDILAPEWVSRWADGSYQTKAQYLAGVAAHNDNYEQTTTDSVSVRLFGPAAAVTGITTERSTFSGKDGSGRYAWLDLFVKRGGRWWAVQSQSTKLP